MPQMMPIWWSILLILSLLFFMTINTLVYYTPLVNLSLMENHSLHLSEKLIDMSKYDL